MMDLLARSTIRFPVCVKPRAEADVSRVYTRLLEAITCEGPSPGTPR